MRKVHRFDKDGFYVEDVILEENQPTPSDCTEILMLEGIWLPAKFEGGQWSTTLTQEEIEAKLNYIPPLSEIDLLKKQQDLMQQAIDDLILGGGF
jgi:hypothetical protein